MAPPKPKKPVFNYARYSSMAIQMAVIIGLGVFGGIKLDAYLGIKFPVFTVILSLASVFLAIYQVIKDLLKK
ncbi:MAG: AtpZ/AtpI family protein [Bacteroidales bacterium]|jgi:hypothetical protein|nr:AtpZ/AtpI family protein [Bacteroidales bacterium]